MPPHFEQPSVYVVGDSISIHYGPALEKALSGFCRYERKSGQSEALINLDDPMGANAGDSRRTLTYLRARFAAGDFSPSILLLNCGLHDIKRELGPKTLQVPLDDYRRNLKQIVGLCRERRTSLVWVRTTPVSEVIHNRPNATFHRFCVDVDTFNTCADTVMAEANVPAIDLFAFTRNRGDDDEIYCDHVHYCDTVREAQGIFIAGCLIGLFFPRISTEGIVPASPLIT